MVEPARPGGRHRRVTRRTRYTSHVERCAHFRTRCPVPLTNHPTGFAPWPSPPPFSPLHRPSQPSGASSSPKRSVTAGACGARSTSSPKPRALTAPIAPIGDVIHNPQVVERLRSRGVNGAASVAEAVDRGVHRVAITAHGMGPHLAAQAAENNLELIDTTCPLVIKVQRLAQKLVRQGYFIVVYGDDYHPEVKSVIGWANTTKAVAAKKIEQLPWNAARGEDGRGQGCAAAQGGAGEPDHQEHRRTDGLRQRPAGDGHPARRRVPALQHHLRTDHRAPEGASPDGR